ncbi:MAG: hypothetical protein ACYC4F_09845 [Armatimonadota bacterium]
MTSLERTLNSIDGKPVDRPPFHPIIMQVAAKYAGIKYRDFCLDWVTVMSDPYVEAEAFGLRVA